METSCHGLFIAFILMFFRSVVNNLYLFERYKGTAGSFFDHLICSLEKRFDLVILVDNFYDNRQIKGEVQKFCRVDTAAGTVRENAAKYCCTRNSLLLCCIHKRLVKRLMS